MSGSVQHAARVNRRTDDRPPNSRLAQQLPIADGLLPGSISVFPEVVLGTSRNGFSSSQTKVPTFVCEGENTFTLLYEQFVSPISTKNYTSNMQVMPPSEFHQLIYTLCKIKTTRKWDHLLQFKINLSKTS